MSAQQPTARQLLKLLRLLSQDRVVLKRERHEGQASPVYRLHGAKKDSKRPIYRPPTALAEHCIKEETLIKSGKGWIIGPNGRLALKRLLAGADPFGEQHQERHVRRRKIADRNEYVVVNDRSSPLGWLSHRKDACGKPLISQTQFAAGERLACDFQFAGLAPRVTSSWSGPAINGQKRSHPSTGMEISDNRLAARQRVRAALDEVGHDLGDILLDICCFQIGLAEAEKKQGWPRRSGKIILQIALDRLAQHYGMKYKNDRHDQSSSIYHWGTKDYKPG